MAKMRAMIRSSAPIAPPATAAGGIEDLPLGALGALWLGGLGPGPGLVVVDDFGVGLLVMGLGLVIGEEGVGVGGSTPGVEGGGNVVLEDEAG